MHTTLYDFIWRWSNEKSGSRKCFFGNKWWKQKWKLKVESNLSRVPEKSEKIFTRHVGDEIFKFMSPIDKISKLHAFASGYLQPWQTFLAFAYGQCLQEDMYPHFPTMQMYIVYNSITFWFI